MAGQFTQEDPIGLAGGLNLYGYGNGDPVNNSDPFGLCPDACVLETGAGLFIAGVAVIATAAAIANGEELGAALNAGVDAAKQTFGAMTAWANNRALGGRISGEMNVVNQHFGFLAGAGGPGKGDPDDPRNRDKWKKDIERHIREAQKYIDKLKGDRNREPYQQALEEAKRRLADTP